MNFKRVSVALLSLAETSRVMSLKIGVISDLHTKMDYDPTSSSNCRTSNSQLYDPYISHILQEKYAETYAMLGRYGCDPSFELNQWILQHFRDTHPDLDLMIVIGDYVAHDVDPSREGWTLQGYLKMLENLNTTTGLITDYFRHIPLINVIGNNDSQMHDQAPNEDFKAHYFNNLWYLWFKTIDSNAFMLEDESIYESFMYGGFYKVDLRDNLSILVLNSIYMDSENDTSYQREEGWNQLRWLEEQLI